MINDVLLRDVAESDLPIFFEQKLDPAANYMAAFTAKDPADREAFTANWAKILGDDTIKIKTILFERNVAGYVLIHGWYGKPEVSYWIGKEYWENGIATQALSEFLGLQEARPLNAWVAKDNIASPPGVEKLWFQNRW